MDHKANLNQAKEAPMPAGMLQSCGTYKKASVAKLELAIRKTQKTGGSRKQKATGLQKYSSFQSNFMQNDAKSIEI